LAWHGQAPLYMRCSISSAFSMFLMTGILTAEMIIEGQREGRLSLAVW
jgi:hypothetical protein